MEKHLDEILTRYYRGEASLKEEQILKEAYRKGELSDNPVLAFGNLNAGIPEKLAGKINCAIQERRKCHIRHRVILGVCAVAATLILILSLRMFLPEAAVSDMQLSDNLKKERFENALRVIGNALEEKPTYNEKVLYEDNKIIIAVE